ncbi:helix-turn-helix domain-containing protein [Streptomyces sp. NPDC008343]|uniref:helix-turn-helix domain-containing protein n=1 Tax=Streptomyces sp. NPDC008343 TaxID=3364828 RepID=UPI0036DFF282
MPGLLDRSRRPLNSPTRLSAEVEAEICEVRRRHSRWGARRICHELAGHGLESASSRATVRRVLSRNGLVRAQEQQHPRKYRRRQREAPMHLWQMDLVGGVPLAEGRECKVVTGTERQAVHRTSYPPPTGGGAVREDLPGERHHPAADQAVFTHHHRQDRAISPHLREEFLDHVVPFESLAAAQDAIDGWVHVYNHQRPYQALDMATPSSLFMPHKAVDRDDEHPDRWSSSRSWPSQSSNRPSCRRREPQSSSKLRVPPSGEITLVTGRQ